MEKRAILAAVLIAALLILYQILFPPVPPPPPPPESAREQKAAPVQEAPAPLPPPLKPLSQAAPPGRVVTVETPLYRARVESEGGKVIEWVIHYRGDKAMVLKDLVGSKGLSLHRDGAAQPLAFEVSPERLVLGAGRPRGDLTLVGADGYGVRVVESLTFSAQDYRLEVHVKIENRHSVAQSAEVLLPWFTQGKWPEGQGEQFQGQRPTRVVRLLPHGVQREEFDKVSETAAAGEWIGLESEWYIAALIPRSPGFKLVTQKGPDGQVEIALKAVPPTLAPGQSWEGRALVYLGPKEYDRLRAVGVGLEQTIHFGELFYLPFLRMEWLAVPILWLMNFVYRYIPNYGVAIILLTVLTKIIFYPLTLKSMASMKAMQTLQPQVNALRAKYQKDPQRLQRETMELYRKHKVNPMGGCLPMVIQIPIFYALYLVFSLSVELQNAAFLCFGKLFGVALWICDLSQYDPTYILPILMGISMFIQQKMTPTVGDPRQAKIMLFMPVLFTFMFLNLPSGLVLYWFVSNVLQILQQSYMDHGAKPAGKESREGKRQ
ncbi:MAG: membrane protein insertase YidC [Candidatus Rokubacteria bacterium]|nr:membrane protein insertase YidC [Candidatus Rokubacteria bacterium]